MKALAVASLRLTAFGFEVSPKKETKDNMLELIKGTFRALKEPFLDTSHRELDSQRAV